MSTEISPENEHFIQQQIASGHFHDRREVLDAGILLLRKKQELLGRLDESRRQLDCGEFAEYDDESLRQRFEQLKDAARARIAANRSKAEQAE